MRVQPNRNMCQQFCIGGLLLILVFTIAFGIAVFLNVTNELKKYAKPDLTASSNNNNNNNNSGAAAHLINTSDLNYLFNSVESCELLFNDSSDSVVDSIFGDSRREVIVPNYNENFPLVVQLNYRTKGNNIDNLCNGVIIHTNYILALAQCLVNNGDRELISATINATINAADKNYKIIDIIIYDESIDQYSKNLVADIGLIKIENNVELINRFCTRRLENTDGILSNVWKGNIYKMATCNLGNVRPNRICVKSVRGAQLGDPLIAHQNGNWYLIGLYQASKSFPVEMSVYTDVYLYRKWIADIIQSNI